MPAETHVEQSPMDRSEVFELVRDRLADILEIDAGTIAEGQSFADDLGADSLALIELVEALEEELAERTVGFRIEDDLNTEKSRRLWLEWKRRTDPEHFPDPKDRTEAGRRAAIGSSARA